MLMDGQYYPLSEFKIEPSMSDLFWQEKVKRAIKDTDSKETLREIATMLCEISIKRQAVVRALIRDMFELQGVHITGAEMDVPELEK